MESRPGTESSASPPSPNKEMKKGKFEQLVETAITKIPRHFKRRLENLVFLVEDRPRREIFGRTGAPPLSAILGTYHGIPYQHRGPFYGNYPPDVIVIYQKPIEAICTNDEEIEAKIKEVVIHEIGHYFGLSEKELQDIENR